MDELNRSLQSVSLRDYRIPSPLAHPIINNYIAENQGYISKENAKDFIIRTRKEFEECLLKKRGPVIIPTHFRNHPERRTYEKERERLLYDQQNPRRQPPIEPPYLFTFPDEVFMNLICNFRNDGFRAYIKQKVRAKLVRLKRESCVQEAFHEMLSRNPHFYWDEWDKKKHSKYIDPDESHWIPIFTDCCNVYQFVVDFSMIYPEGKISSVIVMCFDCGRFVESIFCGSVIEKIKKEIFHNICQLNVNAEKTDPVTGVLAITTKGMKPPGCVFAEGLIGITPLFGHPTKPSLLIRTRLTLFLNTDPSFGLVLHSPIEEDLYPDYNELLAKFNVK